MIPMIQLKKLLKEGEDITPEVKLQAIAKVTWLRVKFGGEAMSLLLTSERYLLVCDV
jgi:hypothetical protein